jgi:mRNA-degrading endonuclease RelE of RelBE toxin-antitoxin system
VQAVIAEIVSLSAYESQASKLMNEDERLAMEFFIACGPEDHPVIAGTGGFRKARWARQGKGKSGGFRVIYYFADEVGRIYMASIYAKSRQGTLTATDRSVLAKLAVEIKKAMRGIR